MTTETQDLYQRPAHVYNKISAPRTLYCCTCSYRAYNQLQMGANGISAGAAGTAHALSQRYAVRGRLRL